MDHNTNNKSNECGGCPCCSHDLDSKVGDVSGGKLIGFAFLVFVAPLIAGVVGAGVTKEYYSDKVPAMVVGAILSALIMIFIAKLITRSFGPAAANKQRPTCPRSS